MISADMLAYVDDINPDKVSIYSPETNTNTPLHQTLGQAILRYTTLEPVHTNEPAFSDHEDFYNAGIDAVVFTENEDNPNWHNAGDSTDTPLYLNYSYGAENAKALAGYLGEQAQAILPITLDPPIMNGNLFTLSWDTTPGVSYAAYSRISLTDTNGWQPLIQFGPSPTNSTLAVQVNIGGENTQIFKVDSF